MSEIQYGESLGFQTLSQLVGDSLDFSTLGQVLGDIYGFNTLVLYNSEILQFRTLSQIVGSTMYFTTLTQVGGDVDGFQTSRQYWGELDTFRTSSFATGNVKYFKTLEQTSWERGDWRKYVVQEDLSQGLMDTVYWDQEGKYFTLYDELDMNIGPLIQGDPNDNSQVWITYRSKKDGDIYVVRSDSEYREWEYRERLIARSGSKNPSIVTDKQGRYLVAVECLLGEESHIWISEYPYNIDNLHRIDYGQYPVLGKDFEGNIYLFYQSEDRKTILYRFSEDGFSSVKELPYSDGTDIRPVGFYEYFTEVSPSHSTYRYLLYFYTEDGVLRYYLSKEMEWYGD